MSDHTAGRDDSDGRDDRAAMGDSVGRRDRFRTEAEVENLLAEMTSEDATLVPPPPDLWERIAAETNAGVAPSGRGDDPGVGQPEMAEPAEVVSLESRRRFRPALLGAAAALLAMVVGGWVGGWLGFGSEPAEPPELASGELSHAADFDPLGRDAAALARLVDDDGLRLTLDQVRLPTSAAIGQTADLELWLIAPDGAGNPTDLVSLGFVDPEALGSFVVPAGYDTDVYSVVDISIEPDDGDPTHSGRSILRGALEPS